jgi:hypothetical protein
MQHPTLKYLPTSYQEYPAPTYVPKGYQLIEAFTDRLDGFRRPDDIDKDSSEVAFWYANPKHPLGFNNPLSVYVTRQPQHNHLATVGDRKGAPMVLHTASGQDVQAEYHDGFWVISWDEPGSLPAKHIELPDGSTVLLIWEANNVHSLTFRVRGFTIGVRGSRLVGVELDELIRVASSIA